MARAVAYEPLVPVEDFEPRSSLRTGRIVVAIQALDVPLDGSDFSLLAVLKAEIPWDAPRREKLVGEFRRLSEGPGSEACLADLEGRLAWRDGERERAAERFARADATSRSRAALRRRAPAASGRSALSRGGRGARG